MDLILNVNFKKKLEPGDVLFFDGKSWTNLSKEELLVQLNNELKEIKAKLPKLDELEKKVAELRGEE